jgi:hypothetical protein
MTTLQFQIKDYRNYLVEQKIIKFTIGFSKFKLL